MKMALQEPVLRICFNKMQLLGLSTMGSWGITREANSPLDEMETSKISQYQDFSRAGPVRQTSKQYNGEPITDGRTLTSKINKSIEDRQV